MRIQILAVGKLKGPGYRELADEYLKRLTRYTQCEERELLRERALESALPNSGRIVALTVDGKALTSLTLARQLQTWSDDGGGRLCFVIGGATGLSDAVLRRVHAQLSLSSLTLPHRLARVVLLEQLYRAFTIMRGEPYARED